MTLGDLVDRAAERLGEREALVFEDQRWSFRALRDDVDRAARGFLGLGVAPGEHVAMWLPNGPEWLHVFYALAKIGAVAVPISTRFRTVDLEYVLRQSDVSTLVMVDHAGPIDHTALLRELLPEIAEPAPVVSARFPALRRVIVLGRDVPAGALSWTDVLAGGAPIDAAVLAARQGAVDARSPVVMLYTSGTTGTPKGALHNHAMVRTVTDGVNRLGLTSRDTVLHFLPLFHSFGLYLGAILFLVAGARFVLMERFDAGLALSLLGRARVTFLTGFDTHFHDLLEHPRFRKADRASLRLVFMPAGSAASEPVARRVIRKLCPLVSGYGSTEAGTGIAFSFLDASEDERCLRSGYPLPGYEFRVGDVMRGGLAPAGTPGELMIRGHGVMLGYYGKPAETAAVLDADGFFRTGDVATIDGDGFLRYVGRYKDMLKIGGENVDPLEVETFLAGHPDIARVHVVGVPDLRLGEVVVACVIPREGRRVTVEDLRVFSQGKIASFKIPREVVVVSDFPTTTTGKVQRAALRDRVLQRST
jgi:fatty-acyl-CoA synthase